MKLVKKSKNTDKVSSEKPKYANLKEVMDYKRGFSMFYSGVENPAYLEICYNMGIRNFLMSYEYLRTKGAKQLKTYPDISLFIDSGAYTYMANPEYHDYTVEQWEQHIQSYLNWARKHKDSIFGMAELDLQNLVGLDVVNRWRREYFEPFMLETGIPVCFVYHDDGLDVWDFMCKRYPYVGFSSVSDDKVMDLSQFKEMLKYTEKYNSLAHGFGMTKTALLPELPFYTVDSTTWLVGLQYGEMNFWTGNKMTRLKKDKWQSNKYLDEICNRYSLDRDLLLNEDPTSMMRANLGAFIDAENYITDRLKSLLYWLKPKAVKTDINNLPEDFFPTVEWFDSGSTEGLKDYCTKMNVNPEVEGARNILYDITTFLNWNTGTHQKMVDWYNDSEQESLITELHDLYVNRIVPDKETKVKDLINFFTDCVSGNNDKLLNLGTNFDRIVKERKEEEYVQDDEVEYIELSKEEVKSRLHNLLPDKSMELDSEAPEIDSLDEEIFKKAEIIPTFDEHGKFVKGQMIARKPKRVYSKKFPKLSCDTCYAAAKCPEYKSGYVCAYNKMFDRFDTRSMGDIIQAMQGIVEYNMTRMQKAMIFETLNGAVDPQVSQLMDTNIKYMQMLKQMYETGSPEVLRQTRVLRADGTEETTTSITNPQSGGIMEKLFGSMMNKQSNNEDNEVIDVSEIKEADKGESNE